MFKISLEENIKKKYMYWEISIRFQKNQTRVYIFCLIFWDRLYAKVWKQRGDKFGYINLKIRERIFTTEAEEIDKLVGHPLSLKL